VKTQIIRIEPHDDAISVKDKMGWGQTPRILLVWPNRGRMLNRRLDITYLQRHSITLGAQLAFVTKDPDVRHFAGTLNIPVYQNIRKAEESHWRLPRRRKRKKKKRQTRAISQLRFHRNKEERNLHALRQDVHPPSSSVLLHPIPRLIFFALGVLSVLAIGMLLMPSAVIKVLPTTQQHSVSIPITASYEFQNVTLTGEIPIQKTSIVVEGRNTIPASGSIEIPDQKAVGEVIFKNLTDHTVIMPAGTFVSTLDEPPVRFIVTKSSEIAPGDSSTEVLIEAVNPGIHGNVTSNHILAIEGPLGLDLTVTNPLATQGGSNKVSPAPDTRDYDHILEQLIANLKETAENELHSALTTSDIILEVDTNDVEILEAQYIPEEIQPSDQLELRLMLEYTGYYVSGKQLDYLGQAIAEANLPASFDMIPTSLDIHDLNGPVKDPEGFFSWDIQIEWQSRARIDLASAIPLVQWKTPEEAADNLIVNLPIQETIQINLSPEWWPRMPILPFRITVEDYE
jgi:hypothetical protein